MADNRVIDEQTIGDIILCDPITRAGREALARLGLTIKDVSPSYFYENLRVESKYDEQKVYEDIASNDRGLYYQYTVDFEQFELLKRRFKEFDTRFYSNSPNEYPLLMLGVAGNGKTIEVNRRIRAISPGEAEFECGRAYFDLEEAFTKVTYGVSYQCRSHRPLWLFCIKLLDGIMQYIKRCHALCPTILENFNNFISKNNLADEKQKLLFRNIGNYRDGDNEKETAVFCSLKDFLTSQRAEKDIQTLLEILMLIMYCSAPDKKQYIVIDNIEQYIKLNNSKIQIPNSDIATIYQSINMVVTNVVNSFSRIEKDLGWKVFKIIIVTRRTSIGLLDSVFLHTPLKAELNITDVTGHIQVSDIWKAKKHYIWEEKLCSEFDSSDNKNIIKIVDLVMNDGTQATGTDYQSIIAPLMSYGIRRNAKAQAHAAYKTYEVLADRNEATINFDEFYNMLSAARNENNTVRYMLRRALIEFQFKWSISSGNQNRWKNLGIGYLTGSYNKKGFMIEGVAYDTEYVTLIRRILTYLSCFPDTNNISENGKNKSVVDMFSTISLFDLMKGVLVNPVGKSTVSDDVLLQFARALIALSDMSNGDTKGAPYVILGVKDSKFHRNASEFVLVQLLKKIWSAGYEKSLPEEIYNCSDYGARITDAGHSFMLDWQASFSFMSALHCFTVPSLFFLKEMASIKYVIETVYNASLGLCDKYEAEAARFCGNGVTLKRGTYLPKYNDKYVTFKQRVKELHINHLTLYREFIESNYNILNISKRSMEELTDRKLGFISRYIAKYDAWKTEEGAPECF